MSAFILRFQESTTASEQGSVRCGTETLTAVRSEQTDLDPKTGTNVLNIPPVFAGTATATKISAEESDRDPQIPKFRVFGENPIQVHMATKTTTFVRAEAADKDVSEARYSLF
jgi:hypothetical protein